jgi:hypothetical protein
MRDEPGAATAAHDLGGKVPQRGRGLQSPAIVTPWGFEGLWNVQVRGIVRRHTSRDVIDRREVARAQVTSKFHVKDGE